MTATATEEGTNNGPVLVAWAASQVVVLVIVQCLITSEATADQLAMVAALQIRVPSIPMGVNLLDSSENTTSTSSTSSTSQTANTGRPTPSNLLVKQVAQTL